MNEQRFEQNSDTNRPTKFGSVIIPVKIIGESKMDLPIRVKRQKLALSDSILSVGQLLATRLESFTVEPLPYEPRIFSRQGNLVQVKIQMDLDLYIYTRTAYALLDFLRDIGGLFGAFNAIFTGIVLILNFDGMYQWLSSMLFRVQSLKDASERAAIVGDKRG